MSVQVFGLRFRLYISGFRGLVCSTSQGSGGWFALHPRVQGVGLLYIPGFRGLVCSTSQGSGGWFALHLRVQGVGLPGPPSANWSNVGSDPG
jgi:hypothetical protein